MVMLQSLVTQPSSLSQIIITNHSLTDFQHNPKYFLEQIKATQKPIILTVNGKAEVVIQDAVAYQKLLPRLDYTKSVVAIS